jgi:hypothetical protein
MRTMDTTVLEPTIDRYQRCIDVSKRINWDIDRDVIRGRSFNFTKKFMPDGLSKIDSLPFLSAVDARFLSQIQGRTYANMFALVEAFISVKMEALGDASMNSGATRHEALDRFTQEEHKHRELFRRIDLLVAQGMPAGYRFTPVEADVASFVLGKSTWAVLALTCHIEIFSQVHYRLSIEPDADLSGLWKDIFFFHWKEESQHAIVDELEWDREDALLNSAERVAATNELIELVEGIDAMLQFQAQADVEYFCANAQSTYTAVESTELERQTLRAYRWQYILSGVQEARFADRLRKLVGDAEMARIGGKLAGLA